MRQLAADRADRDVGDYQHRATGHARLLCARAVIATMVGTFFRALANAVPGSFLHYSIVWAVIDGVDVVAHNAARLSVFLRTQLCAPLMVRRRRCWRQHGTVGCVV